MRSFECLGKGSFYSYTDTHTRVCVYDHDGAMMMIACINSVCVCTYRRGFTFWTVVVHLVTPFAPAIIYGSMVESFKCSLDECIRKIPGATSPCCQTSSRAEPSP